MNTSAPDRERTPEVEAFRVRERRALRHDRAGISPLYRPFGRGQLGAVVDACDLLRIPDGDARDRNTVADRQADHVGQKELALRIVVAQRFQPVPERTGGQHHHPGVDLVDRRLRRGGVTVLDDPRDRPRVVAQHAAVAFGPRDHGGQQRDPARGGRPEQAPQTVRRDQRHIAEEDQDLMIGGDRRQRVA